MPRAVRLIAVLLALVAITATGKTVAGELDQQVATLEATIENLKSAEQQARAAVVDARTKVQTLEQQKLRHDRQHAAATKALEDLGKQKPEKEAAAVKAQQARTAAGEKLTIAESAFNGAKDKGEAEKAPAEAALAEARKGVEAADEGLKAPAAELLKTLESIAVNTQQQQQAQGEITRLTGEIEAGKTALAAAEQAATTATTQRLDQERGLQRTLTEAGRWVSFTDEVAPILHQRCAACHNARSAKGRLNLESYASLSQGGESGESFIRGNPGESLLCTMVADGSMPQDADPLTPEQIATLNRWVEFGARLDAGVEPAAKLLYVMPRRPQPAPPEHYPAAPAVTAVAWSPDGAWLATSGYREVLLWSAADGTLHRRLQNVAATIYGLSFHPDGQRLAVAAGTPSETGEVKVFRVTDGELLADLVRSDDVVLGVAFSPDGSKLAACGADRAIRLFDASSGDPLAMIEDHADWVLSVTWSADGAKLVSASRDKTSKVFDAASGDALGTFNGHGETTYGAAFTADGKQAVSCGADKFLRVWNVEDSKELRKIDGAGGDVLQLRLLPDGRVASCGSDRLGRVQQIADAKTLVTLAEQPDWVYSIDVHPATNQIATGCADGVVRLWKLDDGAAIRQWRAAP
jgi:mono/diheme cytochrome c family protein